MSESFEIVRLKIKGLLENLSPLKGAILVTLHPTSGFSKRRFHHFVGQTSYTVGDIINNQGVIVIGGEGHLVTCQQDHITCQHDGKSSRQDHIYNVSIKDPL